MTIPSRLPARRKWVAFPTLVMPFMASLAAWRQLFLMFPLDSRELLCRFRRGRIGRSVDDAGNCGGVGSASDAVDYYCAYGKLAFVAFASGFALDQGCEELGIADACRDYAAFFFFGFTGRCVGFCTAAFGCFCGSVIAFVCAASLAAISWRVSPLSTSKSTEMKSEEI